MRHRGCGRVGDDPEGGLEPGTALEEVLGHEHEDGCHDDGGDELPDEGPEHPSYTAPDEEMTESVDRGAGNEEDARLPEPAGLGHVAEEPVRIDHHPAPQHRQRLDRGAHLGLGDRHAALLTAGAYSRPEAAP